METVVKTAPAPPRSAERLMQALSTLAALLDRTINEVKNLDKEFETRLHRDVQDTVSRVRDEVSRDLTDRFQQEMQTLLEASRIEFETEREQIVFAGTLVESGLHCIEIAIEIASRTGARLERSRTCRAVDEAAFRFDALIIHAI